MGTNDKLGRGLVIEVLPNTTYKIQTEDGREVRAYLSGKMKMNHINVLLGDYVEYVIDQQGPNNRVVRRL